MWKQNLDNLINGILTEIEINSLKEYKKALNNNNKYNSSLNKQIILEILEIINIKLNELDNIYKVKNTNVENEEDKINDENLKQINKYNEMIEEKIFECLNIILWKIKNNINNNSNIDIEYFYSFVFLINKANNLRENPEYKLFNLEWGLFLLNLLKVSLENHLKKINNKK